MHAYGGCLWPSKQQQVQQEQGQQSVAESMLYTDVPWRRYWPCLLPWVILEAILSVPWLHNAVGKFLHLSALLAVTTRIDGGSLASCEWYHNAPWCYDTNAFFCMLSLLVRAGFWLDLAEERRGLLYGSDTDSAGLAIALCNYQHAKAGVLTVTVMLTVTATVTAMLTTTVVLCFGISSELSLVQDLQSCRFVSSNDILN